MAVACAERRSATTTVSRTATSTSREVEVAVRETVVVALRLSAQATAIEPLTVTARQQPRQQPALAATGFYEREARGMGKFLRREDIERVPESNVIHVLARVPGVTLDVNRAGTEIVSFSRARMQGTLSRSRQRMDICYPAIYLDGARVVYGDQSHAVARSVDSTIPNLANVIPVAQIEAVEVYRSAAELPPQYSGSEGSCGVIVFWSRHEIAAAPPAR
jgi:outer membrane receptor for ferrienterochelin and colicin